MKEFFCVKKVVFWKTYLLLNKNLYSILNKSMNGGVFFLTTEMKHVMLLTKHVIMWASNWHWSFYTRVTLVNSFSFLMSSEMLSQLVEYPWCRECHWAWDLGISFVQQGGSFVQQSGSFVQQGKFCQTIRTTFHQKLLQKVGSKSPIDPKRIFRCNPLKGCMYL